jgi:hypothetical protein
MKRARSPSPTGLARLFDLPELFLHILSFLEPADLARIQGVNTHWQRMAGDPELWRRLYLSTLIVWSS